MFLTSIIFFVLSLAVVLFNSTAHVDVVKENSLWLAGIFMLIALATFVKGIFAKRRIRRESPHSLP
jgi:hypothetical protein